MRRPQIETGGRRGLARPGRRGDRRPGPGMRGPRVGARVCQGSTFGGGDRSVEAKSRDPKTRQREVRCSIFAGDIVGHAGVEGGRD